MIRRAEVTLMAGAVALVWGATDVTAQAEGESSATREDAVVTYDATKGRELDAGQTMFVRISNSVQPAQSVIVSVISATRPEYVLGAVPVGETREWKIDTRLYVGGVRFIARGAGGRTVVNGIQAVGSTRARWNLGLNFMRFERLEPTETAR